MGDKLTVLSMGEPVKLFAWMPGEKLAAMGFSSCFVVQHGGDAEGMIYERNARVEMEHLGNGGDLVELTIKPSESVMRMIGEFVDHFNLHDAKDLEEGYAEKVEALRQWYDAVGGKGIDDDIEP